jgi:hypothetical protein
MAPTRTPSGSGKIASATFLGLLALFALALPGGWKFLALIPALMMLGTVAPARAGTTVWDLPGQTGNFDQDVSGESFHAAEFARVMKGVRVTAHGVEVFERASLVPEPHNKFDPHAVAVVVRGQTLGYLPRGDAAVYQSTFLAAVKAGRDPQVAARLYARRDASIPGGRLNSVRVDLAPLSVITRG